jgi:hypothetical protein
MDIRLIAETFFATRFDGTLAILGAIALLADRPCWLPKEPHSAAANGTTASLHLVGGDIEIPLRALGGLPDN